MEPDPAAPAQLVRAVLGSKSGLAGAAILAALLAVSAAALAAVSPEDIAGWNDPARWLHLPKAAVPAWAGALGAGVPEHVVIEGIAAEPEMRGAMYRASQAFEAEYGHAGFPSDFIYEYEAEYEGSPLLRLSVQRPDGTSMRIMDLALPHSEGRTVHASRVFSADAALEASVRAGAHGYGFGVHSLPAEEIVFSQMQRHEALQGTYVFSADLYSATGPASILSSAMIIGGGAYGAMGTDELRRDLAAGLVWGTPLALFIGVTVAAGSVMMGLLYGVYAGYRGGLTDESMMRANDVVYALPALPFLIILAVTVGSSMLLIIAFLVVFGWVGVAKVARSMALQVRARSYIEAAQMMGQKDGRIIIRHILPQLLPYAFASIAISVPAAITTEAGLSFLGLGDPTFPTWGKMLHDANVYGAAARGLWWWIVPPGLMIAVTGLAFVLVGGAVERATDPRARR